ncbi:MAG: DNA mismatch repair endonuclease MutL [Bacillota bacterium]|nr:DNA mismatch repair endonuclease MutL [Bacillota bacterium]
MTKINILSPLLADMIAAGEVVERPASVIKELMENSFDAGAKKVTVEFNRGGAPYIRVTDDGCGMSPEDAGIAFMRHATSKLHDEKGLEAIGTMGFRGEALAAISAVSKIELVTREKGAGEGTRVTVQAGDIVDMGPCGCPEGTSITIRDIFFNTPARLKFLKSDRAEASACIAAALRCALGRPEASVKCIRDGEEEFFTPGDGRTDSAVYSLLGRDIANTLLPCKGGSEGISAEGFVSSPSAGRGSRAQQYFFCNGRFIKSALLQAAVEQAYKNTLLVGRFPACVIYLSLSCGSVDVNVHPAKTEVKFSDEKKVFDLVYQTVKATLEGESKPVEISLSPSTKKAVAEPKPDFFKTMPAKDYAKAAEKSSGVSSFRSPAPAVSYTHSAPAYAPAPVKPASAPIARPAAAAVSPCEPVRQNVPNYFDTFGNMSQKVEKSLEIPRKTVENSVESVEKPTAPAHRVIGEALNTYILVEMGDELLLIDKHAAHERMIFDRLKAREREIMSQTLLDPVIIKPSAEDAEIIETRRELFSSLGFEIEAYGISDYAVRSLPDDMDVSEAAAALEEICEKLKKGTVLSADSARDEILHTVACKAAIKAGKRHDTAELQRIADAVAAGEVKYCPHGRPVSVSLTKKELDKFFSRIV